MNILPLQIVTAVLALSLGASSNTPASAGGIELNDRLTIDGSMRFRSELDGKDFSNATAMNELPILRTRLGLGINAIENVLVYFQFQDSRNLGVNSGGLADDISLGVHQSFIKMYNLLVEGVSLQVGRFEVPYGRQRLLGPVGWHNVGRTWDGIRASFTDETLKVDLFSLKQIDRSFDTPPNHKDWVLYGIYTTLIHKYLDLFVLYDWDQTRVAGEEALRRFTIGAYFKHAKKSGLQFELDAAYQAGKKAEKNISGYMLAGDVSYLLNSKLKPRFGLGFDITSGDDGSDTTKIKSFNNLYYTGHKFRGFMDFFLTPTTEGLIDIIARTSLKPSKSTQLSLDIHHFQTMENHPTPDGGFSIAIGQEADLTGKLEWQQGLSIQIGASVFFASNEWKKDSDSALWLYAMITAVF